MTRTSVVSHVANQQLVVIRQDYLAICEGNHCAAALLNVFEYWTNIKTGSSQQSKEHNRILEAGGKEQSQDEELWIYKSNPELRTELLGLFAKTKIQKSLEYLVTKGFITTRNNPKYGWDRTLQYLFMTDAVITSLHSVKISDGKAKNSPLKVSKRTDGKAKKSRAIPETTTETTTEEKNNTGEQGSHIQSSTSYFTAIAQGAWSVTDLKGLSEDSRNRIGSLVKVAKTLNCARVPDISDEQGAALVAKFCAAEKFKPGIQGKSTFELKYAAWLEKNAPYLKSYLASLAPKIIKDDKDIECVDPAEVERIIKETTAAMGKAKVPA